MAGEGCASSSGSAFAPLAQITSESVGDSCEKASAAQFFIGDTVRWRLIGTKWCREEIVPEAVEQHGNSLMLVAATDEQQMQDRALQVLPYESHLTIAVFLRQLGQRRQQEHVRARIRVQSGNLMPSVGKDATPEVDTVREFMLDAGQ